MRIATCEAGAAHARTSTQASFSGRAARTAAASAAGSAGASNSAMAESVKMPPTTVWRRSVKLAPSA